MPKITAIVNQKDGVGKATTALNLGYALSEENKQYFLILFWWRGSDSIEI